jgi:hypothetical protein
MKRILLILFLLSGLLVEAQPGGGEKREKIEAMRVAFITKRLDLSSKEAQNFWPVFNEYQDKLEALRASRRKEMKNLRDKLDQLNDKEAEGFIDGELNFKQKELDLQKAYFAKFKQVLPLSKVAMLMRAEDEFKKELLKQIKERGQ